LLGAEAGFFTALLGGVAATAETAGALFAAGVADFVLRMDWIN